ncbi:Ig-like domain-containing protein [Chloroflexota bacterium]
MRYFRLKHIVTTLLYALLASVLVLTMIPNVVKAQEPEPPFPGAKRGQQAVEALRDRLPEVALKHMNSAQELKQILLRENDLWVDPLDNLLYLCSFNLPEGAPEANPGPTSLDAPFPSDQTFLLHSQEGASRVIYLDFDGHVTEGTIWNGGSAVVSPPYDSDGNPASFSDAELERIQYIWQRVAEDYIFYNIDVTTEDPGVEALSNSGGGDSDYGIRVVITSDDWYGPYGGVAYVTSFNWSSDTPCFVFSNNLGNGNEKYVTEAASHEVGHTLGLYHDGKTRRPRTEYYEGHGDWAPIMGVGYYREITQWSKGEYAFANNHEDDLARMTLFGANYQTDDHVDNIGSTATPLTVTGVDLSGSGIIERNTDIDVFSFQTGPGPITINVVPAPRGPNLDIQLQLLSTGGSLIAENDPYYELPASLTVNVDGGTYFILLDGVGTGDPNTGYSDYASLGQYFISGTVVAPGSNQPPVAINDDYSTDEDTVLTVAAPGVLGNDSDPDSDPLTSVSVTNPDNGAVTLNSDGSFTYTPDANWNGTDTFTYKANDGMAYSNIATVTITVKAVNDAPVANNDSYSTSEGTVLTVAAPGVLGNDSDPDGDSLTSTQVTDPANGTITLNSDGSFTYTPDAGFSGSDTFTYKTNDGMVNSNVAATVTITVTATPSTTIHVADLDGTSELGRRGRWNATVIITVQDAGDNLVAGATVKGVWSDGAKGSSSDVTDVDGQCSVTKTNIKGSSTSVTFTITSVEQADYTYNSGDNHETTIIVLKP